MIKDGQLVEHLGDGAYVTIRPYDIVLTANHHEEMQATDAVFLTPKAFESLVELVAYYKEEMSKRDD